MMSCNNQEKERTNILELEKNMVDGNGVLNAASADKLIEAYDINEVAERLGKIYDN